MADYLITTQFYLILDDRPSTYRRIILCKKWAFRVYVCNYPNDVMALKRPLFVLDITDAYDCLFSQQQVVWFYQRTYSLLTFFAFQKSRHYTQCQTFHFANISILMWPPVNCFAKKPICIFYDWNANSNSKQGACYEIISKTYESSSWEMISFC